MEAHGQCRAWHGTRPPLCAVRRQPSPHSLDPAGFPAAHAAAGKEWEGRSAAKPPCGAHLCASRARLAAAMAARHGGLVLERLRAGTVNNTPSCNGCTVSPELIPGRLYVMGSSKLLAAAWEAASRCISCAAAVRHTAEMAQGARPSARCCAAIQAAAKCRGIMCAQLPARPPAPSGAPAGSPRRCTPAHRCAFLPAPAAGASCAACGLNPTVSGAPRSITPQSLV